VIGSTFGSTQASRSGRLPAALACALWVLGLASLAYGATRFDAFVSRASAQDSNASDWGGGPPEQSQCAPKCRRGHECRHGECVPICSPACGPGLLCTSGGTCVRTDAPEPVPQTPSSGWGAGSQQCLPSCRTGYLCVSGQCMSACNPICPAGEMCTERGECVSGGPAAATPAEKTEGAPAEPAKEARSTSADSIVNLHADVLGLLQFGLTPTLEVGGKHVAGFVRFRPLNTGLLSYFMLDHEEDDKFEWGLGGALGLHVFSAGAGNMRGAFGGVALEYVYGQSKNEELWARFKTHVLIPQVDAGYRWGFGHFLLGVGGRIGVSIPVAASDELTSDAPDGLGGMCTGCDEERDVSVVGGIFLDLGYFF